MTQGNTAAVKEREAEHRTEQMTGSTELAERASAPVVLPVPRVVRPAPAMLDMSLGAIRYSEDFAHFAMALSQAQGEFQDIEKRRIAKVESRREGARGYTYAYADLSDVLLATRPALSKNQIAVMQFPRVINKQAIVTTVLIHSSGEWFAGDSLPVQLDNFDPQAGGSAQTYARRYGLCSMLGLAPGDKDDDGAAAGAKKEEPATVPSGFEAWWLDMTALADNGWPDLEAAWGKSNADFKNYVARHQFEQWKALKAKALGVKSR
jgi:hypothetical protein